MYIFTTFDDPSAAIGTFANALNDTGQIVGNTSNSGSQDGFLLSGGTYTAIDDPSATNQTVAQGINDAGQIVGWCSNNSGNHGFLLANGVYAAIDDPSTTNGTLAFGINDLGQVVGRNPDARVMHFNAKLVFGLAAADHDPAARRRVFYRVVDQVPQNAFQQERIAHDDRAAPNGAQFQAADLSGAWCWRSNRKETEGGHHDDF